MWKLEAKQCGMCYERKSKSCFVLLFKILCMKLACFNYYYILEAFFSASEVDYSHEENL